MIASVSTLFRLKIMGRLFVTIGITLCAFGQIVGAQTRFTPRDTTPDLSRYNTVEECLAGSNRVAFSHKKELLHWSDTLELLGGEEFDSLPAPVYQFSYRCLEKFDSKSEPDKLYRLWISLYLKAGNDDAARSIANRKLAASSWRGEDTTAGLENIFNTVIREYTAARPYRSELIEELFDMYLEGPKRPTLLDHLSMLNLHRIRHELRLGDSTSGKSHARRTLLLVDSLGGLKENRKFMQKDGPELIASLREIIEHNTLMDSLRVSGQAYANFKLSLWENVTGGSKVEFVRVLNEKAKPLSADFLFAENGERIATLGDATHESDLTESTFPALGKVSLVIFLYGGCQEDSPGNTGKVRTSHAVTCLAEYSILKRIAKNYPDLSISIVSRTMGYLGQLGPLAPEEEANMLNEWWHKHHQLPGPLLVTNTQYFRLPGYDRRRIDNPDDNVMKYAFLSYQRDRQEVGNKMIYLIDSDGTVLEMDQLSQLTEKKIKPMLDIITQRGK